jgi:PAS domain S-box-containing protein
MLAFLRRRVGLKIILGYLIALALMVGIGFFALTRLDQINSTVDNLTNKLAVERSLAQDTVSQIWLARFYANKYVRTQAQVDLDQFDAEFKKLGDLLVRADTVITDAARREKLNAIKPNVQDYGDAFGQVAELIRQRQKMKSEILDVQGLLVDNKLAALRIGVNALSDPQAFLAFSNAQNGFQTMRLNATNYLATSDEGYFVLFGKGYQAASTAFSDLASILKEPSQSKNAADAQGAANAYYNGFQTIHTDNLKLKDLFKTRLDVLEPEISATASDIAASVAQAFQEQNESSQALVAQTRIVLGGTTLLAIVVGLSLGVWLSRLITRPLQRVMRTSQQIANVDLQALIVQLEALAQGDIRLNLTITAQPLDVESQDEVGQMAAAFNEITARLRQAEQAFKDMAVYLNKMANAATDVARGNLAVTVSVQSQADVLGNALAGMVSELRTAEAELRKHQEHLQELVEERTHDVQREKQYFESLVLNSPVAIIVVDLDNKVVSWNPAAERLFGYTQIEAIGCRIDDLVAPGNMQTEATTYSQQTLNGDFIHSVTQRRRKDRILVDVEMLGVPVDVEGVRVGAVAMYHDITELQRARQEAEAANRAKSAFLAVMSHEIRTPMNGIIGMTSLLLDTTLSTEQRDYAGTIRDSGEALLTIINDILDFSKIEAGKMDFENQPFDLRECVESALDLVVGRAREKKLELVYLIDSQAPAVLMGDVTRVRQVLLNLLSNAIKFTEIGEVVVSVSADRDVTSPHYMLQFTVRDTGIGIPDERKERLFQSFSQIDASTTRKYGGTGLGLAISKRLSELMGGTMWVESETGQGSTFHFTIQAEAAPAQARIYLHSEQPQLRDRRVLIVDDNATNRRVLVAQTRSWNMLPRETASPHEAAEWIRRGDPFDVALLDMQMPEMDGVALAIEMRRYRDARSLPIVMLSSLDRRQTSPENVQFAAYLTKPIKQSMLYDALVEIFVGQPATVRTRQSVEEPQFDIHLADRLPLRVLVAEDNAVNQKLALQMLRRMGYRADVAGNGIEVLEALERQPYDVVLMDVQMPEMDGMEATRQIRQRWPQEHRPHIIAMTANAMQGDREACLAAGMDDYISKPIRVKELQAALERWGQKEPILPEPTPPSEPTSATIDWSVLDGLHELQEEGEPDFVQEMIDLYLSNTPSLIESIRQAITQNQAEALRHAAHTLKGNSNSLGAKQMGVLSLELEKIGHGGVLDGAGSLLANLEREFERVRQAFQGRKG